MGSRGRRVGRAKRVAKIAFAWRGRPKDSIHEAWGEFNGVLGGEVAGGGRGAGAGGGFIECGG